MGAFIDLTGQRFGRLVVIERAPRKDRFTRWLCRCDCGAESAPQASALRGGMTQSCGCVRNEKNTARCRIHGLSQSVEYPVWWQMRARCNNYWHVHYADYGGRGIKVCERWGSFENFLFDMGPRPSRLHELDRRNNNGDYTPENCRWVTLTEQARNKRNSVFVDVGDRRIHIAEAAEQAGLSYFTVAGRRRRGLTFATGLLDPVRGARR